jgi:hypothetical protein
MLEVTFNVSANTDAPTHKVKATVPGTPAEWISNGWDIQPTLLAQGRIRVQGALRRNWDKWFAGLRGADLVDAIGRKSTELFAAGGYTKGGMGRKQYYLPKDTPQEVVDVLVAQGVEVILTDDEIEV